MPSYALFTPSSLQDSYQLALELDNAWKQGVESGTPVDVVSSLRRYYIDFFPFS